VTDIDRLWLRACAGDKQAFGDWMGRVERPVLRSLWAFARATDTESVVQETMLRMWVHAQDGARPLEGENASLRFAIGLARNLARNMARKQKRERLLPPEELPQGIDDAPADLPPDPLLGRLIEKCIQALTARTRNALRARLERGHIEDRALAGMLRMTLNTFLQNISRARRQLDACLERNGVREHEALR
jgi:DNA-directed RNA polymerase specialized sigma24 family protein